MKSVSSGAITTEPVEDSLARMTTVSSKDSLAKIMFSGNLLRKFTSRRWFKRRNKRIKE